MTTFDASDLLIAAGALLLAATMWLISKPLGLAVLGCECVALGFVLSNNNNR